MVLTAERSRRRLCDGDLVGLISHALLSSSSQVLGASGGQRVRVCCKMPGSLGAAAVRTERGKKEALLSRCRRSPVVVIRSASGLRLQPSPVSHARRPSIRRTVALLFFFLRIIFHRVKVTDLYPATHHGDTPDREPSQHRVANVGTASRNGAAAVRGRKPLLDTCGRVFPRWAGRSAAAGRRGKQMRANRTLAASVPFVYR